MAHAQGNLTEALIPSNDGKYPKYKKTSSVILGICHFVTISAMVGISIAGVAMHDAIRWEYAGPMAWNLVCCVLYVTTAVLVVVAGRTQKRGVVISSMVLSIITSVCAANMAVYSAIVVPVLRFRLSDSIDYYYDDNYDSFRDLPDSDQDFRSALVLYCLMLIASLALTILSIWSSAIGCKVACCGDCCGPQVNQPVIMLTAPVAPVQATQLLPQGPYLLQVASGQGVYQLNQQQGEGPVSGGVLEPPHKV